MPTTTIPTRRWLPREGFHADVLGRLIRNTLLNPTLTLPALLALRFTDAGRALAARSPRALTLAAWAVGLGVARVLNGWLDSGAMNNWTADDSYDWAKEVVVVTGGSDGIGKRVVQMLATRRIAVVVLDVQPLTYECPPTVTFIPCDITSTPAIEAAQSTIAATLGAPTILINNAGVCRGKALLANTDADLSLTFNVNAIAHYKLARAFCPAMIAANHGMVVTVASTAAYVAAPRMTDYAATKSAAMAFHEGLAAELAPVAPAVRAVLVNPSYTRTPLFEGFGVRSDAFFAPALHVDTVAESIVEKVVAGRSGMVVLPGPAALMLVHFRSFPNWLQHLGRRQWVVLMQGWKGRQVDMLAKE